MKQTFLLVAALCCALILASCSSDDKPKQRDEAAIEDLLSTLPYTADMILPDEGPGISLASSVSSIQRAEARDSLGAEADRYINANLIGRAKADYKWNDRVINVETVQLASLSDGFGFYAAMRPSGATIDEVGPESFLLGNRFVFSRGEYVVILTAETGDSASVAAMRSLAHRINDGIQAPTIPPTYYFLFPFANKIVPSQKYSSRDFLGLQGIDSVFSVNYQLYEDTVTLFYCMDTIGVRFQQLSHLAKEFGEVTPAPDAFEYEGKSSLVFEHPEYGTIIAGTIRRKLVGVVGYNRNSSVEFCTRWVRGLK